MAHNVFVCDMTADECERVVLNSARCKSPLVVVRMRAPCLLVTPFARSDAMTVVANVAVFVVLWFFMHVMRAYLSCPSFAQSAA